MFFKQVLVDGRRCIDAKISLIIKSILIGFDVNHVA